MSYRLFCGFSRKADVGMLTHRRARFSESLEAGRYGTAWPDNRMPRALSALLHYLPHLSGRPAPPSPAPSAHLLGRTIYREKTERIGAARSLHFPCNRTFRCTSGSFAGRSAYVKEKTKTKKKWRGGGHRGRSEKPLRSFPSSAFRYPSLDGM